VPHAAGLAPLPKCEELSRRLYDAAEDIIDPRLPLLEALPLRASENGDGYVVLRVAKSPSGPHRLTTTREFYVRRGERCSKMTTREIKDLTLELARTGDLIEQSLGSQRLLAKRAFQEYQTSLSGSKSDALLVRATAVPVIPHRILQLTSRKRELWWTGNSFSAEINGKRYDIPYPAREFVRDPRVQLRALVVQPEQGDSSVGRLLRDDGLVEFRMFHPREQKNPRKLPIVLYVGWLLSLVVGTLCQVEHLRRGLAWDAVPYGLEIEILASNSLELAWNDRDRHFDSIQNRQPLPIRFPLYEVGSFDEFDGLLSEFVGDAMNAWGQEWDSRAIAAPWNTLLPE